MVAYCKSKDGHNIVHYGYSGKSALVLNSGIVGSNTHLVLKYDRVMRRILHTLVLALLGASFVIMCFPTWQSRWLAGEGDYIYTYHRWFATPIGFFDVVAPTVMLLTVVVTILVASRARRATTSWVQIGISGATALFVSTLGSNPTMAGMVHGCGVWVAPLLWSATLLLLILRLMTPKQV